MRLRILLFVAALACSGPAFAQSGGVQVELNKLQPVDDACRAYLVTQNLSDTAFDSLKLDVVMFDADGIVAKRLAIQLAPIPAGKTRLKVFDMADLSCGQIGQLLLNNVLECTTTPPAPEDPTADKPAPVAQDDCLSRVTVSQRGDVPFIK